MSESLHSYEHDAMNTTFRLTINDINRDEATGVARECFEFLDYLENKLSRYIEGSDVWQINHMATGDSLFISEPCHECLKQALKACSDTGGLFDISIGKQIEHLKSKAPGPTPGISGVIEINPERPEIHCRKEGREIDLGGIGKGFALDQLKKCMTDWGVRGAMLSAGASTHLVFGENAWPVDLCGDNERIRIQLQNEALSVSGTGIQGSHIISPVESEWESPCKRIWITHSSAAMADAWSTALMLIPLDELSELSAQGCRLYFESNHGSIQKL